MKESGKKELEERIYAQFQLSTGATLRALAVIDRRLAERLAGTLVASIQEFLPPEKRKNNSLFSKTNTGLRREIVLIGALTLSKQPVKLSAILNLLKKEEEKLTLNSLAGHLTRLVEMGAIKRPSKGRYTASAQSADYLQMVVDELAKRS